MTAIEEEIIIPISNTARKYGYIIWRKKDDPIIDAILGTGETVSIDINGQLQRQKRIDRRYRRVAITGRVTRSIPGEKKSMRIKRIGKNRISLTFE